jgi:PP-loop superfamily ATP-utilizing enzyme
MHTPNEKEQALLRLLKEYGALAVAYSGGVDSTNKVKRKKKRVIGVAEK